MKVYIIAHSIRGGGAETYLRGLLPRLINTMDAEYRMTISTSRAKYYEDISKRLTLEIVPDQVLNSTYNRLVFDNFKLAKLVYEYQPDLVFSATEVVPFILKKLKKPIVLVYHSTLQFYMKPDFANSKLKLWYTRMVRDRAADAASMLVAVSHYERAEIGMRYHDKRFENSVVIYHGIDNKIFYPKRFDEETVSLFDFPYIVCVSDYYEHKKMGEMLIIYNLLVGLGVKEHLVIIGRTKNTKLDEFKKQIENLKFADRVHLLEYIDNSRLREIYINASLYWTNSNAESFGMTPLEAMACRVPVFAPWREALPEIYGDSALFYNSFTDTYDEIAKQCFEILSSNSMKELYSEMGYQHSLKFSWENAALEYKKIFIKLIKEMPC